MVVCFDEMGPIQLIPHQGSGWAPTKRPERLRATYSKNDGVRYLFGAYDVHADRLHGRLRPHKSGQEVLALLPPDPDALPTQAPDLPDRRQPLRAQDPRRSASGPSENNVELVFTPTYASFLNRIECHFWAISEFVVNNADYPDWDTLAKAMADHIRYRNGPHRDQRLLKAERRLLIAA